MRFITFFEGVFFSCFYSLSPFLVFDTLQKPLYGRIYFEPEHYKETRYFIVIAIAFLMFSIYSSSGFRGKYTLWHLERNRYASGFTPSETLLVAFYHSIFLCLTSEPLLHWITPPSPLAQKSWAFILNARMKNIFFLSIIQHSLYELSGFGDKIRREYFLVDRV